MVLAQALTFLPHDRDVLGSILIRIVYFHWTSALHYWKSQLEKYKPALCCQG